MTLNGLIKNFTEMFSKKFVCFEGAQKDASIGTSFYATPS